MDGPNIYDLFVRMQALNADVNKNDIVRHLRFFKSEGDYQNYLRHYLPMFAKPEHKEVFDEFVVDLKDGELAKTLALAFKTTETVAEHRENPMNEEISDGKVIRRRRKRS